MSSSGNILEQAKFEKYKNTTHTQNMYGKCLGIMVNSLEKDIRPISQTEPIKYNQRNSQGTGGVFDISNAWQNRRHKQLH